MVARPAQYHRGHLDTDLQQDLLRPGQVQGIFQLPVERDTRIRIAFDATDNLSISLRVIDCNYQTFYAFPAAVAADIPGNLTADGAQLHSYLWRRPDWGAIPAGSYYLLLTVNWNSTDFYQAVSEPFDLQDSHPATMLFEYRNSTNRDGMFFEQLPARIPLRLPAFIADMQALSSDTVYQNQRFDTVPLDSNPFRNWRLYVDPIPDYILDKLNYIFACDYVLLDGKQYTKAGDGAGWEKQGETTSPLWAAQLTIQEANGDEGNVYVDPVIPLYTSPAFPYALTSLTVQQNGLTVQLLPPGTAGYILDNQTQETAMIAALNLVLSSLELFGAISKVNGTLIYTNGAGESYRNGSAALRLTQFGFGFVSPGPTGSGPGTIYPGLSLDFRRAGGVIDWGDGAIEAVAFSVATRTLTHIYTGPAATYNVRIFAGMTYFAVTSPLRSGFTGTLPTGLQSLIIDRGTFPANTFLFSVLAPVAATLQELTVTRTAITAANGFNAVYLPKLTQIDFSQNAFSSNVMSALVYDTHYNASNKQTNNPVIAGGVLSVAAQTTGAALNANGTYYKTTLQNAPFYWQVNS